MSFSAEIKDFVAGFQAGARVGGDIQDRKMAREKWEFDKALDEKKFDLQQKRFEDAQVRSDRTHGLRQRALTEREAARKEREAAKAAEKAERDRARRANELLPEEPKASKPKQPTYEDEYDFDESFGDTGYGDEYEESALPVYEVDEEEVALAEEGGLIEINTEEDDEEEAQASAIPVSPDPAKSPKSDSNGVSVDRSGKSDPLFQEAADITRDVMDKWNEELKEKPEALSTDPKKDQSRVSTVEPASPEAIKAIDAKIDPNGEVEPYRKGAKRLVDAYKFFVEKGDVDKARKIAGEILKYNQMASMTLGTLAKTAIEEGDLVSASKLISDAYNENIPDGGKIEAQATPKGTVVYKIDREGYGQQQGEIGARELWALASGVADGSEFLKRMTALAGEGTPTSESNKPAEGKGKKRGSYTADIADAARAQKDYESFVARYEEASVEEKRKMREEMKRFRDAADRALARAQKAGKKTGRPADTVSKDLANALKSTISALPPEPPADKPEAKTYNSDVVKAARAQSELEALTNSYENLETDEERRAAYPQLQAKQEEYNAAYEAAAKTGEALGRDVLADIGKAAKNVPSALPMAPPEAPAEEPGWWESMFGGGSQPAESAPQSAVPTAPAPAAPAPAPAMSGRPIDATTMAKAKDAIAKGASREAVIKRLQDAGFDTRGL